MGIISTFSIAFHNVYNLYDYTNPTICDILRKPECGSVVYSVLTWSILVGWYEWNRWDTHSFISIMTAITALFGVLYFDETHQCHVPIVYIVFTSMLYFMFINRKFSPVLQYLCISQFIILILLIIEYHYTKKNVFLMEVSAVMAFVLYYCYLHVIQFIGTQSFIEPSSQCLIKHDTHEPQKDQNDKENQESVK